MTTQRKQRWVTLTALGAVLTAPITALAEPTRAERATAETLFESGTALMGDGKFAQACEKFEGSLELDAALGTLLRLADCYDRIGKTASAWALFADAASLAHARGELEREQMAKERGNDLDGRLSRVKLESHPQNAALALQIRVGDTKVPRTSLEAPLPLDPGLEKIEVSAPGYRSFRTTLDVTTGPSLQTLAIPALEREPGAPAAKASTAPRDEASSHPGQTQRTLGWLTGGVGVVALGTGGFFALRAHSVNQESLAHCRPQDDSACDATGVEQRSRAQGLATAATVATIAGGALVAGGLVLVLTAPKHEARAEALSNLRLSGSLDAHGGGIHLSTAW